MINKRYMDKKISFKITMGGINSEISILQNASFGMPSMMDNKKLYAFLPLNEKAYCLSTISQWPDARKRIFNSNMVKNIYDTLVGVLKNELALKISVSSIFRKRISTNLKYFTNDNITNLVENE